MCLTPAAAAAPSAVRPARVLPILIATATGGGGVSTSPRKPVRWRARSSSERQAGTTSTKRNSAAFSSASCEASSIAFSSAALSGLRVAAGSASVQPPPDVEQLLDRSSRRVVHGGGGRLLRHATSCHAADAEHVRCTRRSRGTTLDPVREPGLLSVVAPMHDEEDMVGAFHARTVAALDGIDFELIARRRRLARRHRRAAARARRRRRARQGRRAVAQLRPPGGDQRRARARARRRRRDDRRRPPGPAGADPGDARRVAARRRRRLRGARVARGARRASSSRPRAGSTACSRSSRGSSSRTTRATSG